MPSKRLIASYVLDWVVVIAIIAIGAGINFAHPYHRPFSLVDLTISFPLVDELVTTEILVLVGGLAPLVIVALLVLAFVPGQRFRRSAQKGEVIRLKLWELEKGIIGLILSLAVAFFITQGMKNLFGKPRPDLLARCDPDLNNIADHVVGVQYGQTVDPRWVLVSSTICQTTDQYQLDDGFRSFPSGHSSFSWAGLLYLSLFLCAKFAIAIPFLPQETTSETNPRSTSESHRLLPMNSQGRYSGDEDQDKILDQPSASGAAPKPIEIRNRAAAPPNHLIILAFFPVAVAIWICSTRYSDFYHHGFDIISGSLIGILSAYFAFRWYHLPIRSGRGWAWGSRSRARAFGIGVGTPNYVGEEGWDSAGRKRRDDVEAGAA